MSDPETEHWQAEYKVNRRLRDIANLVRSQVGTALGGLPSQLMLDPRAFDNPDSELVVALMPIFPKQVDKDPDILVDFDFNFGSRFRQAWGYAGRVADLLGMQVEGVPERVSVARGSLKVRSVPEECPGEPMPFGPLGAPFQQYSIRR